VLVLLLKLTGAELIKDNCYMEKLYANICKQWGARLKTIISKTYFPQPPSRKRYQRQMKH